MLTQEQLIGKRVFDIVVSLIGLFFLSIPIIILIVISSFSCKRLGIFFQQRVGRNAKLFTIYKIRTMRSIDVFSDSKLIVLDKFGITIKGDKRVTAFGNFLRRYKLDELPQLYNVLVGDMSFVGPRPDVIGYADRLEEKDRIILTVKPGITGPATLAFRNEESLLSKQKDPFAYNNEVIWPKKIKLNRQYVEHWSFKKDIKYIFQTIFN